MRRNANGESLDDTTESVSGHVVIMAGGTGGHIVPALTTAKALQQKGYTVSWLASRGGMEVDWVKRSGFPVVTLPISGLRGKSLSRWVVTPFKLLISILYCIRYFFKVKPICCLGMGGYVSGPGGIAAFLCRVPLVIHEQNAVPGMTNHFLSKLARKTLQAFPDTFSFGITTGNPVRSEILAIEAPVDRFQRQQDRPLRLLVFGGSLGAVRLNEVVPEAVSKLPSNEHVEIRHQAGKRNVDACRASYERFSIEADIQPFIDDMASALAWADLVICRAGALTISELAAAGVASILVPYPYAINNHQTDNARYLVNADAALLVQERDLNADWLQQTLSNFFHQREALIQMACRAREIAKPQATDEVVKYCLEVARA